MLSRKMLQAMFEYDHAIDNKLITLAANVPAEDWNSPEKVASWNLHETLWHTLVVADEWIDFCRTGQTCFEVIAFGDYPDAASLLAYSDHIYAKIAAFLENIDEDGLTGEISGILPHGEHSTVIVWRVLMHALYHSAQHRSEAAMLLTSLGYSPSFIDFYGRMWERAEQALS